MKISTRGAVAPFHALEALKAANAAAASGRGVLHMEVGEPMTGAPAAVRRAAARALDETHLGYTEALGLLALRERIAVFYRERYDIEVAAERVVVTTGSSGAFLLSFLAAFDAGDRVVLAAPTYPAYRNILTALDIEPVIVPTGRESRYQLSPAHLDSIEGRIDGLLVASPANPTGSMLGREALKGLIAYCADRRVRFISDEIYHGITYGQKAVTALAFADDAIIINSFSKYFCMTGWRLGWMIVPQDLVRSAERLAQNLFISPPALSQHAALHAFDSGAELDENVARYARNRAHLLCELPAAGFTRLAPADGAFYLFADVSHLTNDSDEFCRRMLEQTGVATAPGIDFDSETGHRFLRFSFAGHTEDVVEAATRLRGWLA